MSTAFGILHDKVVCFPIRTHLRRVGEHGRLPSVVLPVVRIDANFAIMVVIFVRAPHCFEVVHVKVHIDGVFFDQLDTQLLASVRKRTVLTILTLFAGRLGTDTVCGGVEIRSAELRLVFIRMIKFFHSVVRSLALISQVTLPVQPRP